MHTQTATTLEKMFSLEGKRGILTGGSSGLGLATSQVLAEAGAEVFVLSRSGAVKVEHDAQHSSIHHIKADVSDYDAIKPVVDKLGGDGLDFLVNNAGITEKARAEDFAIAAFEKIQQVNVEAIFNLCQLCFPYLKEAAGAGRIVSISSLAAHLGFAEVAPYCVSKAAVTGLTRGLAYRMGAGQYPGQLSRPGLVSLRDQQASRRQRAAKEDPRPNAAAPLWRAGRTGRHGVVSGFPGGVLYNGPGLRRRRGRAGLWFLMEL